MSRSACASVSVALLLIVTPAVRAEAPLALWSQIRSAELDRSATVEVRSVEIDLGQAVLQLEEGWLVPARPLAGRTFELVFVGRGRFLIDPKDELEREQLHRFTGNRVLDTAIDRVVFAVGDEAAGRRLLDRDKVAEPDADALRMAEDTYATWVEGAHRRGLGADAAILQSALADSIYQQYFVAWCHSPDLGDLYYTFDPGELEPVTLGQFVPIEADVREEQKIRKAISRGKRKGRFSQLRFEDLGDWDTWVSTAPVGDDGKPQRGGPGFESEHYVLDVSLDPKTEMLEGRAEIRVRAGIAGRRVAHFGLFADLTVDRVQLGGNALVWVRSGSDLHVVLPAAVSAGETLTFDVRWKGKALGKFEGGVVPLRDTFAWYPRIGAVDRATYDVTLRWPKRHELLAGGRVVESGMDDGRRWERRTLETPAIAFSFEVGDYEIHQVQAGHVALTIGIARVSGGLQKGAKQETIDTIADALAFHEDRFGAYPLDTLTVATVQRPFSQGFLSFVTLSHLLLTDTPYPRVVGDVWLDHDPARRSERRRETIAHELAHQWWGNRVGWDTYRDQWLSEALADYSATLYIAHKSNRKAVYLAGHARRWKSSVNGITPGGRAVESLGPVVLGTRLNSSQSSSAYQALVYDKGSVVFGMLARALGTEPFTEMLGVLAQAVDNRVIDTATFLSAIERMSGLDLAPFADQFIYGTGVPEIYYTYAFERDGDGWVIEGTARQVAQARQSYQLTRTNAETWNVTHSGSEAIDVSDWALAVPFQVALSDAEDRTTGSRSRAKTTTQTGLGGMLVVQGAETGFRIPIPKKPDNFWLDQRGEVLATFYCEQREPKRMLQYRAIELARAGDHADAEALFRRSLEAPLYSEDALADPPSDKELARLARNRDAVTHVELARMFIDQGRDADAIVELDAADGLLTGLHKTYFKATRSVLRAQLDVRSGNYKGAYDRLSRIAYLEFPVEEHDTLGAGARRARFKSGDRWILTGRGYALLAVAAFETDHMPVALRAHEEAEEKGADMGPLARLLAPGE